MSGSGTGEDKLRLEDFEQKIRVRPIERGDYEELVALQRRCFPGINDLWERDEIESQLDVFPEGQICVELDGRIVGSASSLIVDYDRYEDWHDWERISDSGYIRTHEPDGDTLYGIEIMVDPEYRGMHLAQRLYDARKDLCRRLNLARIVIGGRIPGYGDQPEDMTAREYVEKVTERGLYDPVLTTQVANGFVLRALVPNYYPLDEASRGYATHLEWTNLDYVPERQRSWHRVMPVRLCAVQYQMRPIESWEAFCRQCAYFLDAAADQGSDFVLFPELVTTQLLGLEPDGQPADAVRGVARRTPDYLEFFTRAAVKYNVNIIGGSQFTLQGDHLYNIAYLFRRDGTIEQQTKLHVTPDERRWWGLEGGDDLAVFDTDHGKVGILISYDVVFPELARVAAARGAEIIFVPFAANDRSAYLRTRYAAMSRAVENNVFVAIAGCTGNLPFVDNADVHYAQSAIFTPLDFSFARDGIAAESTPNVETLVIADLDLELLRRHRYSGTVQPWTDRRADLFSIRWAWGGGVEEGPV
ncbi:MAG: bifunctional GNAT family N-acetyltransferase/carbon-nitrogen hydrolase family protein [Gemmatimonadota bacterium]|nr:bifunctional GNAT family N-acetyltransferase/carbon-nitrogen hydrolase family protein [Gemmatimonadota bacterium]